MLGLSVMLVRNKGVIVKWLCILCFVFRFEFLLMLKLSFEI